MGLLTTNRGIRLPIDRYDIDISLDEDDYTVIIDTTTAPRNVYLPDLVNYDKKMYNITKEDGSPNFVTIHADTGQSILTST